MLSKSDDQLNGIIKIQRLRQTASFYLELCLWYTHEEYNFPQLRDKKPWNMLGEWIISVHVAFKSFLYPLQRSHNVIKDNKYWYCPFHYIRSTLGLN